jgi:hypothetical protein
MVAIAVAFATLPRAWSGPASPTAIDELRAILEHSKPPEYRRMGSNGMAAVADHIAESLQASGLTVHRHDVPDVRYAVDYTPGREPMLERVDDGHRFKTESAFALLAPRADEVECTVRVVEEVQPGDCGFVAFADASPEWNNLGADPRALVGQIIDRGGVGAVIQGDVANDLVFATRIKAPIPVVVSVIREGEVLGRRLRIRARGGTQPAVMHNVIGVRRPPPGSNRWLVLQAHADGWFQAAADNGSGTAAVLRAARLLSENPPPVGLLVALYDGEELGLLGSKAFSQALLAPEGFDVGDCGTRIRMADLAAIVNLDASSARPSDVTSAVGDLPLFSWRTLITSASPGLAALYNGVMATHGVLGLPLTAYIATAANGGVDRSDTRWFHDVGVPIMWPVAGYPEYHTDGDDLDAVDPVDLENVAEGTADVIRRLATLPIERVAGAPLLADPGPPALGTCPAAVGTGGGPSPPRAVPLPATR